MNTASPTTRPAHSASKLRECLLDTDTPRLRFFAGRNPAYPLVAREWRNIFPCCSRRQGRSNGFSQIRRHFMYHTTGDSFFGHKVDLSNPLKCRELCEDPLAFWALVFLALTFSYFPFDSVPRHFVSRVVQTPSTLSHRDKRPKSLQILDSESLGLDELDEMIEILSSSIQSLVVELLGTIESLSSCFAKRF